MEDADRWYFSKSQLENTPSRKCGIGSAKELSYRQQAADFIQDMGQRLHVSHLPISTAIVYMHRFYIFHSFTQVHRNSLSVAALFLAAKVEEEPRKLEHVIKVAHVCLHKDGPPLDVRTEAYVDKQVEVVALENVLLQTLGFSLAVKHPHTFVVKIRQLVNASKELAQTAYRLATNSLRRTTMCLQYKPEVVACVCIRLACKQLNVKITDKDWYCHHDNTITLDIIDSLTKEFSAVLERSQSCCNKKVSKDQVDNGLKPGAVLTKSGTASPKPSLKDASKKPGMESPLKLSRSSKEISIPKKKLESPESTRKKSKMQSPADKKDRELREKIHNNKYEKLKQPTPKTESEGDKQALALTKATGILPGIKLNMLAQKTSSKLPDDIAAAIECMANESMSPVKPSSEVKKTSETSHVNGESPKKQNVEPQLLPSFINNSAKETKPIEVNSKSSDFASIDKLAVSADKAKQHKKNAHILKDDGLPLPVIPDYSKLASNMEKLIKEKESLPPRKKLKLDPTMLSPVRPAEKEKPLPPEAKSVKPNSNTIKLEPKDAKPVNGNPHREEKNGEISPDKRTKAAKRIHHANSAVVKKESIIDNKKLDLLQAKLNEHDGLFTVNSDVPKVSPNSSFLSKSSLVDTLQSVAMELSNQNFNPMFLSKHKFESNAIKDENVLKVPEISAELKFEPVEDKKPGIKLSQAITALPNVPSLVALCEKKPSHSLDEVVKRLNQKAECNNLNLSKSEPNLPTPNNCILPVTVNSQTTKSSVKTEQAENSNLSRKRPMPDPVVVLEKIDSRLEPKAKTPSKKTCDTSLKKPNKNCDEGNKVNHVESNASSLGSVTHSAPLSSSSSSSTSEAKVSSSSASAIKKKELPRAYRSPEKTSHKRQREKSRHKHSSSSAKSHSHRKSPVASSSGAIKITIPRDKLLASEPSQNSHPKPAVAAPAPSSVVAPEPCFKANLTGSGLKLVLTKDKSGLKSHVALDRQKDSHRHNSHHSSKSKSKHEHSSRKRDTGRKKERRRSGSQKERAPAAASGSQASHSEKLPGFLSFPNNLPTPALNHRTEGRIVR